MPNMHAVLEAETAPPHRPLADGDRRRLAPAVCVACGYWGVAPLCLPCRRTLRPGGSFLIEGVAGRFALHHSGTGRRLVHQLKYRGVVGAADVLSRVMAPLLPDGATAVTPLPRATVRRIAYGVDPARELAKRIAVLVDLPMADILKPPLWWRRNSSRPHSARRRPGFVAKSAPHGLVLIDDVVTSGSTAAGALDALGLPPGTIASVISATSPGMMNESKAPTASRRLRDV